MSEKPSKTSTRSLRLLLIASSLGTAVFMMVPVTQAKKNKSGGTFSVPCGGGTVSISPARLWPPNHKMRSATVTYSDSSDDGGTLSLTVNSITDDQTDVDGAGHGCGSPNQSQDWTFDSTPVTGPDGAISENVTLRAERCANDTENAVKGQRTYDINVTCENDPASPSPTRTAARPRTRRRRPSTRRPPTSP